MTKYWKEITRGAVVKAAVKPQGKWWREATWQEYAAYHRKIEQAAARLERAVAYKARLLGQ